MSSQNCSICQLQQQHNTPEVWCPICEESLCLTCSRQHQVQRATRDHTTISYEDYCKLPPFILKVQLICEEHKEKYQYYCRSHDCAICKICLSMSHKKCSDALDINDVIYNVKTSAVFEDVWRDLKATHQTILKAIKEREENLGELQRKKEVISTHVKERTHRLIDQLKKLENKTLSDLDLVMKENATEIRSRTKILDTEERNIGDILGQKELIKKHASNFQTYFGIKQMEKYVQHTEKTLQTLSEKGAMNLTEIQIENNTMIENTIVEMKSMGEIKVTRKEKTAPIVKDKPNQAQKMVETRFTKQLTLKQQLTLSSGSYYGCCTLPNGLMVLADCDHDEVKILKPDGTVKSSIKCEGGVYDVALINENQFAVSNPELGTIFIIDVDRSGVIKTLRTRQDIGGITYSKGHLLFCVPKKGIMRVSIGTGKVHKVCDDITIDGRSHVDTDGNRICYTSYSKNTITVLDSDYKIIFTYKDENIMSSPIGISVDEHQNTFVSSSFNDKLLLLSRHGDKCEVLFSKADGLFGPRAVYYDRDNKEVIVVDLKCVVRKFSVT